VATVLVIAADPSIEVLVGELITYVGHRPVYDATAGAAGESIRRIRPDVTVLDTALPQPVVDSCLGASDEVGSQPVLMSSTDSAIELEQQARSARRLFFALPAGPKPLANVLDRALSKRAMPTHIALPELSRA
jgi:DNA-binding NtrC family response regulator